MPSKKETPSLIGAVLLRSLPKDFRNIWFMEVYRQLSAMEPLLPKGRNVRLAELTCEILKASGRLTGQVHSPLVLQRVRVRGVRWQI